MPIPMPLGALAKNIIRNAVRFTRSESDVQIVLEIHRSTSEPLVFLSVRDHGPGVPEDSLEAIFQPFYRINGEGEAQEGMVLGFAIASEAIRMHRGTIRARKRPAYGPRIVVQLLRQDIDARGTKNLQARA